MTHDSTIEIRQKAPFTGNAIVFISSYFRNARLHGTIKIENFPSNCMSNNTRKRISLTLVFLVVTQSLLAMPIIVAHRGSSKYAPENTLAAFKLAWVQNADAIEGDFHLTADNEVVCIHDKDTKRVSGKKLVIEENTLEELKNLDVGEGEKIPTLAEILKILPENKLLVTEIKSNKAIVPHFLEILEKNSILPAQIMVISFDIDVLTEIKRLAPQFKTVLLTKFRKRFGKWKPSLHSLINLIQENKLDGASVPLAKCLNRQFIEYFKQKELELHTYTIDREKDARYLSEMGIDSITTNLPLKISNTLE